MPDFSKVIDSVFMQIDCGFKKFKLQKKFFQQIVSKIANIFVIRQNNSVFRQKKITHILKVSVDRNHKFDWHKQTSGY